MLGPGTIALVRWLWRFTWGLLGLALESVSNVALVNGEDGSILPVPSKIGQFRGNTDEGNAIVSVYLDAVIGAMRQEGSAIS